MLPAPSTESGGLIGSESISGSSTASDGNYVSSTGPPLYQTGEHIFFLLVGAKDQESGLHRGQVESVLFPGDVGNPGGQKEIAYLIARTSNGDLITIPERFIRKNKASGIAVSPHERRELMENFSNSTRHSRRIYSRSLKRDYLSDRLSLNSDPTSEDISHLQEGDEAFDSYFALKMDAFDRDFEEKRCKVLSTLRVGLIDSVYSDASIDELKKAKLLRAAQIRFQSLWSALQRVYFNELEDDQSGNQFSIDREFDAATDPEVSNLWTRPLMRKLTNG